MKYVTSIERLFMERGKEQGRQEGELLGQAALIERLLVRRFGPLPEDVKDRIAGATQEQLQLWADRVLDAGSLAEVLGGH